MGVIYIERWKLHGIDGAKYVRVSNFILIICLAWTCFVSVLAHVKVTFDGLPINLVICVTSMICIWTSRCCILEIEFEPMGPVTG